MNSQRGIQRIQVNEKREKPTVILAVPTLFAALSGCAENNDRDDTDDTKK